MNELVRILDDDPSAEHVRLLRSVRLDGPPAGGKEQLLAALGVGSHIATASTAAAGLSTAKPLAIASVWKWLIVGAVAGATTTAAIEIAGRRVGWTEPAAPGRALPSATKSNTIETTKQPSPLAAFDQQPADATKENGQLEVTQPRTSRPEVPAGSASLRSDSNLTQEANPSLKEEVRILDEARRALASGDAARSSGLLDQFNARFTKPRLAPEAALLKVEVLLALGRKSDARRLAESLLASEPDSAHAQRLRTLLQATGHGGR